MAPVKMIGIGDLSRILKCTPRALRFYEEKGLVSPARDGLSRWYSDQDVKRLEMIRGWANAGVHIREIKSLLNTYDRGNIDDVKNRLEARIKRRYNEIHHQSMSVEALHAGLKSGMLTPKQ